jgi:hypothetical protein
VEAAKERGYDVLLFEGPSGFTLYQRRWSRGSMEFPFFRVDSDTIDQLIKKSDSSTTSILTNEQQEAH